MGTITEHHGGKTTDLLVAQDPRRVFAEMVPSLQGEVKRILDPARTDRGISFRSGNSWGSIILVPAIASSNRPLNYHLKRGQQYEIIQCEMGYRSRHDYLCIGRYNTMLKDPCRIAVCTHGTWGVVGRTLAPPGTYMNM